MLTVKTTANLYYSQEHTGTPCVFVSVSMTTPTAWVGFIAMVTSIPFANANTHQLSLSLTHTHKTVTLFRDDVTQYSGW